MRFVDRKDVKDIVTKTTEFVLRYHGAFAFSVFAVFLASILGIFVIVKYMIEHTLPVSGIDTELLPGFIITVAIICLILILLAIYIFFIINKVQFLINIAEFQSKLFAEIIRIGTAFTFIINKEKKLVYTDGKLEKLLSYKGDVDKLFSVLITKAGFSKSSQTKITAAIKNNDSISLPFKLDNKEKISAKLTINPIPNINGYYVIRAYQDTTKNG